MFSEFEAVSVPLERNDSGVIRISGTRVSLDSILYAFFSDGATAEEIVLRFPSSAVQDIYAVIAWALQHPKFIASYLEAQGAAREVLEAQIRAVQPNPGLRERLLTRKAAHDVN